MNSDESRAKVAVVTLQGKVNYGNRLQNYAVVKLYERAGCEAITLLRDSAPSLKRVLLEMLKTVVRQNKRTGEAHIIDERVEAFERFDRALTFLTVDESNVALADQFDFFSVGSDQVWNLGRMTDNDDWYYLRFARPEQRIALAPSIGVSQLGCGQMRRLAKGAKGFPYLSVREEQGADLIAKCSGLDAKVICDPTMVLSPDEWRRVADSRLTPNEPYVFTYLLGEVNSAAENVLPVVTRDGLIPVVPLSDKSRVGEPAAGPAEFISLIDNAEHVVTDSFHAAVFASLLQTPLTIVHREGGTSMFSRLEQLSRMLGIEHKIYGSPSFDPSRAGDYEGTSEVIECERKKFLSYLEMCLNG